LALVSTLPPDLDELRARGLRLASVEWATGRRLGSAKTTSYAENLAAAHAALAAGSDDALLVQRDGLVLETPTANVWWRRDADLYTPALELPILAGVTRSVVWELAEQGGYAAHEAAATLAEVEAADEIFLTASIREVMPVTAVDGKPVADGRPGEAARSLQDALRTLTMTQV
jgi:branched-subunit amino acid aminotransferase/4-amino-4-deoxychorismate lyase